MCFRCFGAAEGGGRSVTGLVSDGMGGLPVWASRSGPAVFLAANTHTGTVRIG